MEGENCFLLEIIIIYTVYIITVILIILVYAIEMTIYCGIFEGLRAEIGLVEACLFSSTKCPVINGAVINANKRWWRAILFVMLINCWK